MRTFDGFSTEDLERCIVENRVATGNARECLRSIKAARFFDSDWPARDAFLESAAKLIDDLDGEYGQMVQERKRRMAVGTR